MLQAFAEESFRQLDQLETFYSALIDLQLRAQALLLRRQGRALTLEEVLIVPPKTKEDSEKGRTPPSSHREEVRIFIRSLVPLYDARAQLLLKTIPSADQTALLDSAIGSMAGDDYSFSRIHGAFQIRRRAAVAVASLRFLCCRLRDAPQAKFESLWRLVDPFGSSELAVLSVFALNVESHNDALNIMASRSQEIVSQRTVASEKIEALLQISRFVAQMSRDEGSAIFKLAHETTEEIDTDSRHQLRALAAIAKGSCPALQPAARRDVAEKLYSISTDAAVRLSDSGRISLGGT